LFNFNLNYNGIVKYKALGRVMSTMTNPIYYGIYLIFIFIITSYLLLESNNLKIKYILILNTILILSVINIFLTFTRSTYLLFLGSLFLISIINLKNIKKLLKNYIFIFLTIILMFILMPSIRLALKSAVIESIPTSILKKTDIKNSSMVKNQEEENKKIVYEDNTDYSIVTRHQFKTISKKVIKDHLIFGVGFGAYEQFFKDENNYKKYIVDRFGFPHDNFMHIFAETGILGFISFIIVIIMLMVIILHHYFINYDKLILYNFIMFIIVFLIMFYESFFYDSLIVPIYLGITSLSLNYVKEKKKCV
jgi:O-antigen ligase